MQGVFGTPLRGMVLCAGLGTRLGGLSAERPKPLLPVCDYPLARYALSLLKGYDITDVVINLHHLGEQIEAELGSGADLGMQLSYSREPEILGTGGGLRQARLLQQTRREHDLPAPGLQVGLQPVAGRRLRARGGLAIHPVRARQHAAHMRDLLGGQQTGYLDKHA